jgi:hypothetical protein
MDGAASEESRAPRRTGIGLLGLPVGVPSDIFIWVCIYSGEEARMSRKVNE